MWILFVFLHFAAPVLCLFGLTKHAVESVQLSAPKEVTAAYGGSVTVSCQYNPRFREYTKYWCKGQRYELCAIVVKTPKDRPSNRSFIADDKEAGVFTVTMTSLKESDQDMYWCVIARHGRNIYTSVKLCISHTETQLGEQTLHQMQASWYSCFDSTGLLLTQKDTNSLTTLFSIPKLLLLFHTL